MSGNGAAFLKQTTGDALVVDFAKAALQGVLADPMCSPKNQERLNEVCDFCWTVALTMVERRPPISESVQ